MMHKSAYQACAELQELQQLNRYVLGRLALCAGV